MQRLRLDCVVFIKSFDGEKEMISGGLFEVVIASYGCFPVFFGPRKTSQSPGGESAMQPDWREAGL